MKSCKECIYLGFLVKENRKKVCTYEDLPGLLEIVDKNIPGWCPIDTSSKDFILNENKDNEEIKSSKSETKIIQSKYCAFFDKYMGFDFKDKLGRKFTKGQLWRKHNFDKMSIDGMEKYLNNNYEKIDKI